MEGLCWGTGMEEVYRVVSGGFLLCVRKRGGNYVGRCVCVGGGAVIQGVT